MEQLSAILQNPRARIVLIGGFLLVVAVILFFVFAGPKDDGDPGAQELGKDQKVLAEVQGMGKAIEIQALLAREGLHVDVEAGTGGKATVVFPRKGKSTLEERDRALITLVQSGLVDGNVGLEAFDKGDLTASKDEKEIKKIRAKQGELARLIRKIKPIEEATVSLSIPEPTIFKSQQEPKSASIQVVIPNGARLPRDKVRAIINLAVGSIQGLDAQHVALSDTNGNTYNSVLDLGSELQDKLEEQDQYMKQKVATQLDRLVGPGNYVVTVSTLLREATQEMMVQNFDPTGKVVASEQVFSENLGSSANQTSNVGGAVSSFLPKGTETATVSGNNSDRNYTRAGKEVAYANSKTQWVETRMPGMVEDISVAVTIDEGAFPTEMSMNELRMLVAHAASPKVEAENVSIARANFKSSSLAPLTSLKGTTKSSEEFNWMPWAAGAGGVMILLLAVGMMSSGGGGGNPKQAIETRREIEQLRQDMTAQQQAQLQATQQQIQRLETQQRQLTSIPQPTVDQVNQLNELKQTLAELKSTVEEEEFDEGDLDLQVKSWIESS